MFDKFEAIELESIKDNVFKMIGKDWFLITAGSPDHFNTMTAAWGNLGILWNKPIITTFIRPTRYTYEFSEPSEFFTACFFEGKYRKVLNFCGTRSGRDVNKVEACNLTPVSTKKNNVFFEEARLVLECRKIYYDDLKPALFLDDAIKKHYSLKDYHRFYIGEIINCWIKKDENEN